MRNGDLANDIRRGGRLVLIGVKEAVVDLTPRAPAIAFGVIRPTTMSNQAASAIVELMSVVHI